MKEDADENEISNEDWRNSKSEKKANVPLNVNTGAIGKFRMTFLRKNIGKCSKTFLTAFFLQVQMEHFLR